MKNYPKYLKSTLDSVIHEMGKHPEDFCRSPGRDFTRERKLPFQSVLSLLVKMGGDALRDEMLDCIDRTEDLASVSAFVQQRNKLLPEALEYLFHRFTNTCVKPQLYKGYRLLAIDGSDLQYTADPADVQSYFPGTDSQMHYSVLHLNTLYDLTARCYLDAVIQKRRSWDERAALFPAAELKHLYHLRWGIETAFRQLKHTIGLRQFQSKKVENITQEIFASLTMYNFCELITSHVVIQKKHGKFVYQTNFTAAVHICRQFLRGAVPPPKVEALIKQQLVPVRPGRSTPRKHKNVKFNGFLYRIA